MYKLQKYEIELWLNSGKNGFEIGKNLVFILDDDNGKLNGGSDDLSRGPRRHG